MSKEAVVTEITDDIEIIGPGQMLADARSGMGLSQEDVAKRLNFRLALVKDIENECFDRSLPATYNRGYLKSYAKLVNVDESDVLSSFESLDAAQAQCAEMQSFSQQTKKQAHNNILMWITYLIIAAVIGSSAMWWLQGQDFANNDGDSNAITNTSSGTSTSNSQPNTQNEIAVQANGLANEQQQAANSQNEDVTSPQPLESQATELVNEQLDNIDDTSAQLAENVTEDKVLSSNDLSAQANVEASQSVETSEIGATARVADELPNAETAASNLVETIAPSKAVFNFSGDCWVNIYDATGERIAWGIKKANYEMNISGIAPLRITLGKPELVQITFNGEAVDMSNFGRGNIAKFTLPLAETSE